MAEYSQTYSGSGASKEETRKAFDDASQSMWEGIGKGALKGAGLGLMAANPIAIAAGAIGGALVGGGAALLGEGGNKAIMADIEAAESRNKQARAAEDAARLEQSAAVTAAKNAPAQKSFALPPAPSDMSILAGSMPGVGAPGMPMDPYRQSLRNKFGWS